MAEPSPWDPRSPRNRDRTRASQRQVRAMLSQWDAIGVSDMPGTADEYDCMIGPLLRQLFDGASVESLAAWIAEERTEHFGLDEDAEADIALAAGLVRWWAARTATD